MSNTRPHSAARGRAPRSCVRRSARIAFAAALLLACIGHAQVARAAPPGAMAAGPYAIRLDGVPLADALKGVASAFDLRFRSTGNLPGRVSGTYKTRSASAFLDEMAERHGFVWFVYGGVLYASSTGSVETARLPIGADRFESARSALTTSRLLEPKFGWSELAEEGVLQVSGPPDYVRLVRSALRPLIDAAQAAGVVPERAPAVRPEVMVFRLRNANAEDRTVTFRSQTVHVPGLATILRTALNGSRNRGTGTGVPLPPESIDTAAAGLRAAQNSVRMAAGRPGTSRAAADVAGPEFGGGSGHGGRGSINIEADQRINAILVLDTPDRRPYYERLIAELDVAQQLIEIEALIIDIDRQLLAELGVEWTASGPNVGYSGTLNTLAGLASTTFVIPDFEKFFARLRALDTSGKAAILAKPSVLTLDNQAAVLDLSTTDFIRLIGERAVDVKEVTAGTLLRVVPRVLDAAHSSSVQMLIDIEDGFLDDGTRRGTPVVQKSTISTQASIAIGQSLVIGGYRSSQQRSETSKVPVLGDLPVVGGLFRSTRTQDRNMERLFIITPRVVGAGSRFPAAPPASAQEAAEGAARRLEPLAPALVPAGEPAAPRARPSQPPSSQPPSSQPPQPVRPEPPQPPASPA